MPPRRRHVTEMAEYATRRRRWPIDTLISPPFIVRQSQPADAAYTNSRVTSENAIIAAATPFDAALVTATQIRRKYAAA